MKYTLEQIDAETAALQKQIERLKRRRENLERECEDKIRQATVESHLRRGYVGAAAAAERLGISQSRLSVLYKSGDIKAEMIGGWYYYAPQELEDVLQGDWLNRKCSEQSANGKACESYVFRESQVCRRHRPDKPSKGTPLGNVGIMAADEEAFDIEESLEIIVDED